MKTDAPHPATQPAADELARVLARCRRRGQAVTQLQRLIREKNQRIAELEAELARMRKVRVAVAQLVRVWQEEKKPES